MLNDLLFETRTGNFVLPLQSFGKVSNLYNVDNDSFLNDAPGYSKILDYMEGDVINLYSDWSFLLHYRERPTFHDLMVFVANPHVVSFQRELQYDVFTQADRYAIHFDDKRPLNSVDLACALFNHLQSDFVISKVGNELVIHGADGQSVLEFSSSIQRLLNHVSFSNSDYFKEKIGFLYKGSYSVLSLSLHPVLIQRLIICVAKVLKLDQVELVGHTLESTGLVFCKEILGVDYVDSPSNATAKVVPGLVPPKAKVDAVNTAISENTDSTVELSDDSVESQDVLDDAFEEEGEILSDDDSDDDGYTPTPVTEEEDYLDDPF